MMSSLTCSSSPFAEHVERLDQPLEILVRLDVAGVEDERIVELVALADAHDLVGRGLFAEALVDGVVDDVDLRFRHVEVLEDVALRGLRDRQDARRPVRRDPQRAARVRVAEPVREVLRKAQVDAVVNRDDRAARRQRRQHVVRRVKQIDPLAAQIERKRELLAHRVVRRRAPERAGSSRRARPQMARSSAGTGRRIRSCRPCARGAEAGCGCRCRSRSRAASGRRWRCARESHLIAPTFALARCALALRRGRLLRRARSTLNLRRQLSLQPQIRAQQRRPARMVLLVEREVAAAIGGVRSRPAGWRGTGRADG